MQASRKELGRIVADKNPIAWAVPDTKEKEHRYFFLDSRISKEGDTPLMRLLALHATPLTVENFLFYAKDRLQYHQRHAILRQENTSNNPNILLKSNNQGVSPLHVLLHRNSFYVGEIVRLLLRVDPTLVRRRMKITGSFPLHISMANSLTIQQEVLEDLLMADPSVVYEEDVDGDNPVSLLCKNVLRFRWARNWVTQSVSPKAKDLTSQSWMTVITPDQFMGYCTAMINAAQGSSCAQDCVTWHNICTFPRCPPLLIKILAQKMSIDSLLQQDEEGCTPLHYAAKGAAMSRASIPQHVLEESKSIVELILSLAPQAASYKDKKNNFPLHYALENPTIESRVIEHLVELSPMEALMAPCKSNGLVPFQLAAARHTVDDSSSDYSLIYNVLLSEPSAIHVA